VKVLVVGNGGREHAIAWKLLQSPKVEQVFCIPGNGGTATLPGCRNISLQVDDFEGIARIASVQGVALVVVGPEAPLAAGIVDYLEYRHIPVFGPSQKGAAIESSKSWAKTLMHQAGVLTAKAEEFTSLTPALQYLETQRFPLVIKADGLASGKGVKIAATLGEAVEAVETLFRQGFTKILLEEFISGREVSILAVTDGTTIRPLLPACDHKKIGEGDTGDNTGGMGVYAPAPWVHPALMARIENEILRPTIATLQAQGITYRGVLYAGLMITDAGDPLVLEFNCRFGDPETQALLPLLETSLVDLLLACIEGRLAKSPPLEWQVGAAVCVVAAAGGYPGKFSRNDEITGLGQPALEDVQVFQAGTILKQQKLLTDGGRVLSVTGIGADLQAASDRAYEELEQINFSEMYYRRDIGRKEVYQSAQITSKDTSEPQPEAS
jgi:phosphoribosylamine--glycine ligase